MSSSATSIITLDEEQRAAVYHDNGPALVLAGAGSGKTRVLTERVVRLVESGVDPARIFVSTFTNKATGEMRDRLEMRIGMAANRLHLGTLHSLCWRLVKERLYVDTPAPKILRYPETCMNHVLEPRTDRNPNGLREKGVDKGACTVSAALRFVDAAKEHLLTPDLLAEHVGDAGLFRMLAGGKSIWQRHFNNARLSTQDAADLYACFEEEKAPDVDFGDMALKLWLAWQQDQEFADHCRRRFLHVLVDEFQDTSFAQWEIVRHLAPRNLFVVGDDWQAVYSFRCATPEYVLRFEEFYPGASIYPIGANYRSIPSVVHLGARLISLNTIQRKKQVRAQRQDPGKVSVVEFATDREEGEQVAATIRSWVDEGVEPEHIACIYRVNRYSAQIELALIEQGVPYQILGGLPFFKWRVVADMLAYLRFAADHQDRKSFERALRAPNRYLGRAFIEQVYKQSGKDLVAACRAASSSLGTRQQDAARTFCGLIDWLALRQGDNPKSMVAHIRDFTRYDHWAAGALVSMDTDEEGGTTDRLPDLDTLEYVASRYDTTDELLAYVDLVLSDSSERGVTLCSTHRAKGLEWERVFLCGAVESLFPHKRSREDADSPILAIEEERRLFYVGMTRARDQLTITHPKMAFNRRQEPSRFIREAGFGDMITAAAQLQENCTDALDKQNYNAAANAQERCQ